MILKRVQGVDALDMYKQNSVKCTAFENQNVILTHVQKKPLNIISHICFVVLEYRSTIK